MIDNQKNLENNIDISKLTLGSSKEIYCVCDYCNKSISKRYFKYNQSRKDIQKDSCNSQECINKKRLEVNNIKFGGNSAMCSSEHKDKHLKSASKGIKHANAIREGVKKKHGVDNVFQLETTKNKIKETCLENYGVEHHMLSEDVKKKQKESFYQKYGVEHALQNPEFLTKLQNTCLEKYGNKSYSLSKAVRYEGKTITELSDELKLSVSHTRNQINKFGFETARKLDKKYTSIEHKIKIWLDSMNIYYEQNKYIIKYYPDFIINNLIIELDGLYWHSDKVIDNNNYHKNKKDFYISKNYQSLFFREDEINNKTKIVQSIILNKLNMSNKLFARKCSIIELDKVSTVDFLEQNHLMGAHLGQGYALLLNEEIVAVMQIRNKLEGIEIARFCTKLNTSIIGGFSKLLKYIELKHQPKFVINFIDLRYGEGTYLSKLGFNKISESLSFKWTDNKKTFNRMQYPGNSGYDNGLCKIWDCGQAKYIKEL